MKLKTTALSLLFLSLPLLSYSQYITPDNNTVYTVSSLSEADGSGVVPYLDGYLINNDITISETDSLKLLSDDRLYLADNVTIYISGTALFNPESTAYIFPENVDARPIGFDISGTAVMENLEMEGAGVKYTGEAPLIVNNCDFYNNNGLMSLYGVIILSGYSSGSKITGCSFTDCVAGAINTPANLGVDLLIENCVITNVSTDNALRPYINVSSPASGEVIIRGNVLNGVKLEKPGGIGVSNMLNAPGDNKVVIENNYVADCSWGINLVGGMDVRLIGNMVKDNCWDPDDNGGIAVTMYSLDSYPLTVYAENNIFEGNKWGPCSVIGSIVNFGKTDDPLADDYNPGNNTFLHNGHIDAAGNEVWVDFCNNSPITAYAQGNIWNDATTAEEAAATIFDNNYSSAYGPVIYDPIKNEVSGIYQNFNPVQENEISVFDLTGREIYTGNDFKASVLTPGIYIIKTGKVSSKIIIP